jgi:nitroreductase
LGISFPTKSHAIRHGLHQGHPPSPHPIHDLIAARWSGRAYDGSKSVSREQTLALLEAARWAPSCYGDQPWRFVVWNQATDVAAWQAAFDTLVPGNQRWVKDAPLLVLVAADTLFSHNGQPNRHAQYDTGAAAENLCLQAEALGLMAHQMGGFDPDRIRAVAKVPAQYTPMALISVGYPADPASFSDDVAKRESAIRHRRSLGELFFDGVWTKPIA